MLSPDEQTARRGKPVVAEPSALEHANHLLQRKRDKAIQTRPKAQRDAAIYARRTAGASYKQLAAEFNLTVKQAYEGKGTASEDDARGTSRGEKTP